MSLDSDLSDALTRRLNLQISLSSLPVVEEWMDTRMGRWLESVPLPPEISGPPAQFLVTVGSDLSWVRWGAGSHPSGYIPKLADYLTKAGISVEEVERINVLGGALEPETVGSWIEVRSGEIHTGWHLLDREALGEVIDLLGDEAAELSAKISATGLLHCTRIARQVDGSPGYEFDLELTGVSEEDALAAASEVLAALGSPLDFPRGDFVNRDLAPVRVVATLGGSRPGGAGVRFGSSSDQVAALCSGLGVTYAPELDAVKRSLQSAGVIGAWVWVGDDGLSVDVDFHPGTHRGEPRSPN